MICPGFEFQQCKPAIEPGKVHGRRTLAVPYYLGGFESFAHVPYTVVVGGQCFPLYRSLVIPSEGEESLVMEERSDKEIASKKQRDQMLRLVTKGFYNELMNCGVGKAEVIRVASHLLDNLLAKEKRPDEEQPYYNGIFTLASVKDEWAKRKQLIIEPVRLRPLKTPIVKKVAGWLKDRAVRESFVPAFPKTVRELKEYFSDPTHEYFIIYYGETAVGIVGGENIDLETGKVEMKKLVGEPGLQGKGIGKRATFGFLYYAFMIRNLNKVYIHSRDINMRNINLNSGFGFELEGVFLDDIIAGDKRQDVIRMALFKPLWLQIFSPRFQREIQ